LDRSAAGFLGGSQAAHAFGIVHRSGGYDVDAHARRSPFDSQSFGEDVDAGLGGAHVRLKGDRHERMRRRNADHRSARRAQMFEGRAAGIEGTEQVDIDHRFEAVGRHAQHGRWKITRRAADQYIDRPILLVCDAQRIFTSLVTAHIARDTHGRAAGGAYLPGRPVQFFLGAAHQGDLRAVLGEAFRDAQIDPAAASGDESDFALEEIVAKNAGHTWCAFPWNGSTRRVRAASRPIYTESMRPPSLRQAIRSLRRRPAFALAAILTLALGVGANTAVYQVIYTVLLRPLPFREPQRLLQLWESTPVLPQLQVTVPDFEDWRKSTHSFAQMGAYTLQAMNHITLVGHGDAEVVQATNATPDLFSTMGIQPLVGRAFSPTEDREKRAVALISEKLWRRKFGADPSIVGKAIRLETQSFTVIGVVPTRQAFPEWTDLWIPFSRLEPDWRDTRKYHPLEVIARLRPGVNEDQAQAEMRILAARLAREHADTNATVGAYVIPLARQLTGEVRPALLLVWTAVGLVLVMACANLAHMVLARMLDRRQEMAIRASLGAGRGVLAQLVLTESLLLAGAGGAAGAVLAMAVSRVLATLAESQIPRMKWPAFQAPVWLFAAVVSILCGLLFALPACAQAWGVEASPRSERSMTKPRSPLSSLLMAAEIAMAFVVLTGAALLVRSFVGLLSEDPGFRSKGVLAMELPLPGSRYDSNTAGRLLHTQLLPAVRALPGVQDVAAANCAPLSLRPTEHSRFATRFGIEGKAFEPGRYPVAQLRWVTPNYFQVLGIPLRRGRWLTEADDEKPRYLINETLARRFFPREDPTARRLILGVLDPQPEAFEIAGVVGDVREMGLDEPAAPTLYQITSSPSMTLLIKSAGRPMSLAAPVREAIHAADSGIAVGRTEPLDGYLADSLARTRFALTLLAAFGGLAAFLTAAGIYGLLAYSLSSRVRELGVRAALGASPGSLIYMILREGAAVAIPGLVAGVALSLAFARLMKTMLYRLSPTDPLSLAAVGLLVSAIVLLSAWLPARRAARVDPSLALQSQY